MYCMYESRGDIRRADTADILMRWGLGPYSCTNLIISVSSLGQRSFSDFRLTQGLKSNTYPRSGSSPSPCSRRLRGPKHRGPVCSCMWIRNTKCPSATEMRRKENDSSPYTREILRATSPDKYDTVLLEIVALAGYVCLEDLPRREPHAGNFTFRRVGFLGLRGEHLHDDAFPLGIVVEKGRFG
jgi:hypothetical protein